MAEPSYWPPLIAAAIGGGAVMAAQFIAQRMTAGRERSTRQHEAEARRRLKLEDLQRQTLVEIQDALGRLLESSCEVATYWMLSRGEGDKGTESLAKEMKAPDFIRPLSRYMESRTKAVGLMTRAAEEGVRKATADTLVAADALRYEKGGREDIQTRITAVQSAYLAACKLTGEIIRSLDEMP
jgi:hypothetical protein